MSTTEIVTLAIAGFFIVLAILVFLRLLLRKGPPHWTELRIGFFVERVPEEDLEEFLPPLQTPPRQPTTLSKPGES